MSFARTVLLVAASTALSLATPLPIAHAQQAASPNGDLQQRQIPALDLACAGQHAAGANGQEPRGQVDGVRECLPARRDSHEREKRRRLRPLQPGKYEFYDDFGGKADGTLTVK
jgi:hypothetical protein